MIAVAATVDADAAAVAVVEAGACLEPFLPECKFMHLIKNYFCRSNSEILLYYSKFVSSSIAVFH